MWSPKNVAAQTAPKVINILCNFQQLHGIQQDFVNWEMELQTTDTPTHAYHSVTRHTLII